jgi:hypothetical protein
MLASHDLNNLINFGIPFLLILDLFYDTVYDFWFSFHGVDLGSVVAFELHSTEKDDLTLLRAGSSSPAAFGMRAISRYGFPSKRPNVEH